MRWAARPRRRSRLRPLVRGAAVAALAGAVAVPVVRRRLRIPPAGTVAAVAAGPPALAVLAPRTRVRDAALYALQMWAFTIAHELPYDDPEGLRRRLKLRYPIDLDRRLGAGVLPNARLQRALSRPDKVDPHDWFLTWVHWLWFFEPHLTLLWIMARDPEQFPRAARQMSAVYDLGCAVYFAAPTAPPWWASENGDTDPDEVRRIMVEVGEQQWGEAWPKLYGALGGNPWAAMPSLHFATAVTAALLLSESSRPAGAAGFAYAGALGFALVYLGEHYVTDLVAGLVLVALVRGGERHVEPAAQAVSRALQRLERIANS